MLRLNKSIESIYRTVRQNIFAFCKLLNFDPTFQQKELLESVQSGKMRIAVKSGQGPGKTAVTAIIALWRCIRDVEAKIIVTAPTMRQCKDQWLGEARHWFEAAKNIFGDFIKITKSKVEVAGNPDWGIFLVTATKTEAMQGIHRGHLTFIAEEASGIERALITQIEGTLGDIGGDQLFIQIGNPNSRQCAFFDCFTSRRKYWDCYTWDAEQSPRISKEWVKYMEDTYGRDSDIFRVRVNGEFPRTDPNCVMSSEDLEACTKVPIYSAAVKNRLFAPTFNAVRQIGIDFARFGLDESVVYRRAGYAIVDQKIFNRVEPSEVIDHAFRMQHDAGWRDSECWYIVDASGMGQGVLHKFYDAGKTVHEFYNQGVPADPDFDNKATEAWFDMAKIVKAKQCHIPKDNDLIQQLCTRQYHMTKKGKIILESKDEYTKRGYESPDRADGAVLTFYDKACVGIRMSGKEQQTAGPVGMRLY